MIADYSIACVGVLYRKQGRLMCSVMLSRILSTQNAVFSVISHGTQIFWSFNFGNYQKFIESISRNSWK